VLFLAADDSMSYEVRHMIVFGKSRAEAEGEAQLVGQD
jgi:hypothetical protein